MLRVPRVAWGAIAGLTQVLLDLALMSRCTQRESDNNEHHAQLYFLGFEHKTTTKTPTLKRKILSSPTSHTAPQVVNGLAMSPMAPYNNLRVTLIIVLKTY